jgi:hypothetical protein
MFARPFASAIVAERAPWSTKCSVVTNVTAAERASGASPAASSLIGEMAVRWFHRRRMASARRFATGEHAPLSVEA